MRRMMFSIFASLLFGVSIAQAEAEPNKPAPAFEVKDATGQTRKLSDFSGKWVVLEWFNKDCPYVKKHYGSKNMQKLQEAAVGKGKDTVWLTVISSAKTHQGYLEPAEATQLMKDQGMHSTALLLDTTGKMGRDYGAKTTPHMFVINPKGNVVYAGAIDSDDSQDPKSIPKAKNFVMEALEMSKKDPNTPLKVASRRPYGCSVKYE